MDTQRHAVNESVQLSAQADAAMAQIREAIGTINGMSSLIATTTEEQSAVSRQIADTIQGTAALSRDSAAEAENNQRFARTLGETSRALNALVAQFR